MNLSSISCNRCGKSISYDKSAGYPASGRLFEGSICSDCVAQDKEDMRHRERLAAHKELQRKDDFNRAWDNEQNKVTNDRRQVELLAELKNIERQKDWIPLTDTELWQKSGTYKDYKSWYDELDEVARKGVSKPDSHSIGYTYIKEKKKLLVEWADTPVFFLPRLVFNLAIFWYLTYRFGGFGIVLALIFLLVSAVLLNALLWDPMHSFLMNGRLETARQRNLNIMIDDVTKDSNLKNSKSELLNITVKGLQSEKPSSSPAKNHQVISSDLSIAKMFDLTPPVKKFRMKLRWPLAAIGVVFFTYLIFFT